MLNYVELRLRWNIGRLFTSVISYAKFTTIIELTNFSHYTHGSVVVLDISDEHSKLFAVTAIGKLNFG